MRIVLMMLSVCLVSRSMATDFVVRKVSGDVSVRHGVAEEWTTVKPGDVLRPHDTMKTGKKASAVLAEVLEDGKDGRKSGKPRALSLPEEVIVDLSDIREISQEELMLKLAMEKVRSSPYQWKKDELNIPNTTVIHGGQGRLSLSPRRENEMEEGVYQLNGTKVLYENGLYPSCVLRMMYVFRLYPALGESFENRLLVAEALDKSNLDGEALSEYVALAISENTSPAQKDLVQERITELKRRRGE